LLMLHPVSPTALDTKVASLTVPGAKRELRDADGNATGAQDQEGRLDQS